MIFLTGGARSGKSKVAVEVAQRHDGTVRYVATALPSDEEMERRIEHHRRHRPHDWTVIEAPIDLAEAVGRTAEDELVIIDCLTLWISNLMVDHDDQTILGMVDEVVTLLARRDTSDVVVSNEVGSGLVPMDPVGRRFRDLQGTVNQEFATKAERAYLVVAGRALELRSFDAG